MSILPITGALASPMLNPTTAAAALDPAGTASAAGASAGTAATSGGSFADVLGNALDAVNGLQANAGNIAVQAASGNVANLHDVMISATEAQLATSLTVAVRDKALTAFTTIMQMPV